MRFGSSWGLVGVTTTVQDERDGREEARLLLLCEPLYSAFGREGNASIYATSHFDNKFARDILFILLFTDNERDAGSSHFPKVIHGIRRLGTLNQDLPYFKTHVIAATPHCPCRVS